MEEETDEITPEIVAGDKSEKSEKENVKEKELLVESDGENSDEEEMFVIDKSGDKNETSKAKESSDKNEVVNKELVEKIDVKDLVVDNEKIIEENESDESDEEVINDQNGKKNETAESNDDSSDEEMANDQSDRFVH